jgi:hypothetical protein
MVTSAGPAQGTQEVQRADLYVRTKGLHGQKEGVESIRRSGKLASISTEGKTCGGSVLSVPDRTDAMAKHAFLLLSHPDRPGKFANPLNYAAQLDEAGHEVAVYFDGAATFWFEDLDERPAPALEAYETAKERGLIAGVCDHCATFKGVAEAVEAEGFEIEGTEHAPDVAGLVEDGYELHTV